jgi:hypothetical protein
VEPEEAEEGGRASTSSFSVLKPSSAQSTTTAFCREKRRKASSSSFFSFPSLRSPLPLRAFRRLLFTAYTLEDARSTAKPDRLRGREGDEDVVLVSFSSSSSFALSPHSFFPIENSNNMPGPHEHEHVHGGGPGGPGGPHGCVLFLSLVCPFPSCFLRRERLSFVPKPMCQLLHRRLRASTPSRFPRRRLLSLLLIRLSLFLFAPSLV